MYVVNEPFSTFYCNGRKMQNGREVFLYSTELSRLSRFRTNSRLKVVSEKQESEPGSPPKIGPF